MKKKIILIVVAIIIGCVGGFVLYNFLAEEDDFVEIKSVSFTMNNIKEVFLETDYAKDNQCKVKIKNGIMRVSCKENYEFSLEDQKLVLKLDSDSNTDIFKYMVDAIETLYGSNFGDYYLTMDKVLNKEAFVVGIDYLNEDGMIVLKVVLDSKLQIYQEKDVVEEVTIKELNDFDYEYKENGYTINNLEVVYDNFINYLIIGGSLNGPDLNVVLNIKLYGTNNRILYDNNMIMDEYDTFNQVYSNFVVNIVLDDEGINYEDIKGYSLSLSKK